MAEGDDLLAQMAEAFKDLADTANSQTPYIEVAPFVRASYLIPPLLDCAGIAFKFAQIEYLSKLDNVAEASKSFATLDSLLDHEIRNNSARIANSHSRNLVKVMRSLDMLRVIFDQTLTTGENSLVGSVSTAYEQVFAPYHGWSIRKAVRASIYGSPTKAQFFKKLNKDEASANVQMKHIVVALASVVQYIEKLILSRESGSELLALN